MGRGDSDVVCVGCDFDLISGGCGDVMCEKIKE